MIRLRLGRVCLLSSFLVAVNATELPADWLRYMVEDYFGEQLQVETNDLEIEYIHLPPSVLREKPQMKCLLESRLTSPRPGYQVLWLKLMSDRTLYQRIPIVVDVTVTRAVVVAARKLERGTILLPEMVATRRMKVNNRYQNLLFNPEAVVGQMVTRTIPKGEIISKSVLKPPPAVRRGEKVTVQIIHGNVMVSTKGTVRQDAQLGERVQITCEPTGKSVRGIVYSSQVIRVTL